MACRDPAVSAVSSACGESSELQDGYYTAQASEFSHGWKEYITIMVKGGSIVSIYDYNTGIAFLSLFKHRLRKLLKGLVGGGSACEGVNSVRTPVLFFFLLFYGSSHMFYLLSADIVVFTPIFVFSSAMESPCLEKIDCGADRGNGPPGRRNDSGVKDGLGKSGAAKRNGFL